MLLGAADPPIARRQQRDADPARSEQLVARHQETAHASAQRQHGGQHRPRHHEADPRTEERRKPLHHDPDREVGGTPDHVDDREGRQNTPRRYVMRVDGRRPSGQLLPSRDA